MLSWSTRPVPTRPVTLAADGEAVGASDRNARDVAGGDARTLGDGAELIGAGRLGQDGDGVGAIHCVLKIVRAIRGNREAVAAVVLKHEGVCCRSKASDSDADRGVAAAVMQVTLTEVTLAVAVPEPPVTAQTLRRIGRLGLNRHSVGAASDARREDEWSRCGDCQIVAAVILEHQARAGEAGNRAADRESGARTGSAGRGRTLLASRCTPRALPLPRVIAAEDRFQPRLHNVVLLEAAQRFVAFCG